MRREANNAIVRVPGSINIKKSKLELPPSFSLILSGVEGASFPPRATLARAPM